MCVDVISDPDGYVVKRRKTTERSFTNFLTDIPQQSSTLDFTQRTQLSLDALLTDISKGC